MHTRFLFHAAKQSFQDDGNVHEPGHALNSTQSYSDVIAIMLGHFDVVAHALLPINGAIENMNSLRKSAPAKRNTIKQTS